MRYFVNNYLEMVSPMVPLLLLILNLKKVSASKTLRLLLLVIGSLFFLNSLAVWYSIFHWRNIWIYDLTCLTSFVTISLFMIHILRSELTKRILSFILPVYITFFLCYTYLLQKAALFNSTSFAILSVLISSYCVLYFIQKINDTDEAKLSDDFLFWVCTGFFVYYLGSFFIFISYKYLTIQGKRIGILWGLHNIIYFIGCSITALGLWKHFQKKHG
jgi:hypothetical protein